MNLTPTPYPHPQQIAEKNNSKIKYTDKWNNSKTVKRYVFIWTEI